MIKVLYIARYPRKSMARKLALMAAQPDIDVTLLRPRFSRSSKKHITSNELDLGELGLRIVPMVGDTQDPHRALYRTLTFALASVKPDIIHVEEEPDSLVSLQVVLARHLLAPKAKLVLHTWQNINRPKAWHVRWVTQHSLHAANAILCANHDGIDVVRQMGYGGPAEVIAPQGVDITYFKPAETSRTGEPFTVLFVGRLVSEKGLDTLIEAVKRLDRPLKLRVVGDGPLQGEVERLVREAGLGESTEIISFVPYAQLLTCYQSADVLVLPSKTTPVWKEQFGRVLIEAMACGTVVVGSASGAIPEVIGDAGMLFPEGDAQSLAACLRCLYFDPAQRLALAERGYRRAVDYFSQERLAQQTEEFYRRLLDG